MALTNIWKRFRDTRAKTDLTITSGTALSPALDMGGMSLQAIQMPGGWDGNRITFDVSSDGVTYGPAKTASGSEYSLNAAADDVIIIPFEELLPVRYIKIRSGINGSPVNQTADRILELVLKAI